MAVSDFSTWRISHSAIHKHIKKNIKLELPQRPFGNNFLFWLLDAVSLLSSDFLLYSAAHEILSILKKPITQESVSPTRKAPVEQGLHSQSSDLVHLDIQHAYVQQSNVSKTGAMEDHEDEFKVLNEGTNGTHTYKNEIPESKALHTDTSFDFIKLEDSDNKAEPESKDSTSSGFNPGLVYSKRCPCWELNLLELKKFTHTVTP